MGTFTISLDCEGRWGTADYDTAFEAMITDDALRKIYDRLFACLERSGVQATFAVVGAFSLSVDALREHPLLTNPPSAQHEEWTARARQQVLQSGETSGWTLPGIRQQIIDGGHELATHGFSHLPFSDRWMNHEAAEAEVSHLREWISSSTAPVTSIVFPRNQVHKLPQLHGLGIRTYRRRIDRDYGAGVTPREILEEVNPWGRPESIDEAIVDDDMVGLPPGRFFNRRAGARALVPPLLTARSWITTVERAADQPDGAAHLWLHPHNLLESETQFGLLERVISHAGALVSDGRLSCATMAELDQRVRP